MRHISRHLVLAVLACLVTSSALAQTAQIQGQVTDPQHAAVPNADVRVVNQATSVERRTKTNDTGMFSFPFLEPGHYKITVQAQGFNTAISDDLIVNVGQALVSNFELKVGTTEQTVTVEGGTPLLNTQGGAVSTVVDRNFAENLPMNGRSFQTLIQLTPGVVLTVPSVKDGGQFSTNGQRATSNYWTLDGVSANVGATTNVVPGNGAAGMLPSFSALGGTNSLVSVDALQEFRIQTSTYAPEFGRTTGGQISIVTRSGTNQFHGTVFDYLRNDVLDANNWFNSSVTPPLPKAKERQNDFGGTFSGPILRDRTFFFFSYEGLRLRLPQTALTTVPDLSARQNAIPAVQAFFNAFPLPNGPDNTASGVAQLNGSFSNPATLDAYSIRIDHTLTKRLTVFGRYNYSPSAYDQRPFALSTIQRSAITTQTATAGAIWLVSPAITNDLRFNYSKTHANGGYFQDNFGGAVPLASAPFPNPFTSQNARFLFGLTSLRQGTLALGLTSDNLQRQINVVDNLSMQRGSHSLKFGVDFRRLSPAFDPTEYSQQDILGSVPSAGAGNLLVGVVGSGKASSLLFHNLGVFAQDNWRIGSRMSLTYGLRWDVDFAPSSAAGPSLLAVTGYDVHDLSHLTLAPPGTPPFTTTYRNVAPRFGVAYQLSKSQERGTVLRGGLGVFYDLATSEVGNVLAGSYPFGVSKSVSGSFPLSPTAAAPPPITEASLGQGFVLYAFDPGLRLPYTLGWSVAVEQALGRQQTISASYIGSLGRRLIQSAFLRTSPTFPAVDLIGNAGTSDYDALQVQFQRRLAHRFQALISYTWSHSLDTGSAGSNVNLANTLVPTLNPNANRGPSDFDIRNAFSGALTYDVPVPKLNPLMNATLRGWSVESIIQARSAAPEDIAYLTAFTNQLIGGASTNIRPDLVPDKPLYLFGPQYPGGKAFNPSAFSPPPADSRGFALRNGTLSRNILRAFPATQWDFAVHREFRLRELFKLQFRAEMFNVLNHPNFGPPPFYLDRPGFGIANQMLGQSLNNGGVGGGALTALYQLGGPRSVQFALKLTF